MERIVVFYLILFLGANLWAAAYVIRRDDTLSGISASRLGPPVYGPNGTLTQILELNPQIKNPDFIRPGQTLKLSEKDQPESTAEKTEATDNTEPVTQQMVTAPQETPEKKIDTVDSPSMAQAPSKHLHWIKPTVGYDFTTYNAHDLQTGGDAKLFSSYSVTVGTDLIYELNSKQSLFVGIDFTELSIQPSTNPQKTLANTNQFLEAFSLGAIQSLPAEIELKYFLEYQNLLFLHGLSTSNVAIDAVPIFSVAINLAKEVFKIKSEHFNLLLGGAYYFPSAADGYNQNSGFSWMAGIEARKDLTETKSLAVFLGFNERRQDSSLTSNVQDDIGLNVSLKTDFLNGQGVRR